jgi:LysR family transcriptional regulator, hca operon transcriptional activator
VGSNRSALPLGVIYLTSRASRCEPVHSAAVAAITADDIVAQQLVGVPYDKSPARRSVTDSCGKRLGIDLTPDHKVDNLSMAMSLAASTGGIALMPLYARNLLPSTVICQPLAGVAPTIDLSLGYNEANKSPPLKTIVSKVGDLKFSRA